MMRSLNPLDQEIDPGTTVLVRAVMTAAGLVLLAPGAEMPPASLDIVAVLPPEAAHGEALVIVFDSEEEREAFERTLREAHDVFDG